MNVSTPPRCSTGLRYLQDLVGVAHGGDLVVGVRPSQLAQVTHGSPAHLAVHVDLLHLVLGAHEHLVEQQTEDE